MTDPDDSADDKRWRSKRNVAKCSTVIANMLEDLDDPREEPIPLMNVHNQIYLKPAWGTIL